MTILRDVLAELVGMFAGDAWLSAAVLAVIGIAAALIDLGGVPPLAGGGMVLAGCLAVLVGAVVRAALRRKAGKASRTT